MRTSVLGFSRKRNPVKEQDYDNHDNKENIVNQMAIIIIIMSCQTKLSCIMTKQDARKL